MAMNFNQRNNPISSFALGFSNDPFLLSPTRSNFGIGHSIRDDGLFSRTRNYGINQIQLIDDRTVTVAVPVPQSGFNVTEVVRTTRFITPNSTMERLLRFPATDNQAGYSTGGISIQPHVPISVRNQLGQVRNPLLSVNPSVSPTTLSFANHDTMEAIVKKEPIFNGNLVRNPFLSTTPFSTTLMSRPTSLSISNRVGNVKEEPVSFNPSSSHSSRHPFTFQNNRQRGVSININDSDNNMGHESGHTADVSNNLAEEQPKSQDTNVERGSEENGNGDTLGRDGRTHSLPNYPEGTYACPICMDTFDTSQKFANHVKVHYMKESEGEKKRRLDAKYKRKKRLRVVNSNDGVSVVLSEADKRRKIKDLKLSKGLSSHEAASKELFLHGVNH